MGHTIMLLERNKSHKWGTVKIDESGGHATCSCCNIKVYFRPGYEKWLTVGYGFSIPTCEDYRSKEIISEKEGGWVPEKEWEHLILHG